MPAPKQRFGQIGDCWLSRRPNSPVWCRTWFDPASRQTRRASLHTEDATAAQISLAEWITRKVPTRRADPANVTVAKVFARYFDQHGSHLIGDGSQRLSLLLVLNHLREGVTVGDLTLNAQHEAVRRMKEAGYGAGTIKRAFGAAKAAVNWAWKNDEIERTIPFLSLPEGAGRKRVLSVDEMAVLWSTDMPDHLRAFVAIVLGTAARPEAALQLTRAQCDLHQGVIDLNPPGREQTKKRRPALPLADWLRPWVESADGYLVHYREKPVLKIAKAFRTLRDAAGFGPDVTSYTLRHSVATQMAIRGVPMAEISQIMGHKMPGSRTTEMYIHVAPEYLINACKALESLAKDIGRAGTRPMDIRSMRSSSVLDT